MRGAYLHPDGEDTILITDNEEYGYLASAYVAIRDSSDRPVALSCVDISMDMINRQIGSFAAAVVLVILAVLLVFIVGYFFLYPTVGLKALKPPESGGEDHCQRTDG